MSLDILNVYVPHGYKKFANLEVNNRHFLTLYWNEINERSLLVYSNPTHTKKYLHYNSHHKTSCKESVLPPCSREYISLSPSLLRMT